MLQIDLDRCDLCGTCVSVCPADCLELSETKLIVDNNKCTGCEICVRLCPFEALAVIG